VDMAPIRIAATVAVVAPLAFGATAAELPEAIAAKGRDGRAPGASAGAQIYECNADAG
jgi:hypothetical protein